MKKKMIIDWRYAFLTGFISIFIALLINRSVGYPAGEIMFRTAVTSILLAAISVIIALRFTEKGSWASYGLILGLSAVLQLLALWIFSFWSPYPSFVTVGITLFSMFTRGVFTAASAYFAILVQEWWSPKQGGKRK